MPFDWSLIMCVSIEIPPFKCSKQPFGRKRNPSVFRSKERDRFVLFSSVLGALLSAHLLIIDPLQPFGDLTIPDYENELLDLAHDLASRLLPAFDRTPHGLPYPRVSRTKTTTVASRFSSD